MDITLSVNGIDELGDKVKSLRTQLAKTIREEVLPYIQETWLGAVSGAQLPGMPKVVNDAQYAAALQRPEALEYPTDGDPLYGRVIVNDPYIRQAEQGKPARDLKPSLLGGPKARRSKRGGRYNIIPIGFSTEGGFDAWQFHGVSPFRTVSDRSPAGSWIYPARPGLGVRDAVAAVVVSHVAELLQQAAAEWER